MGKPKEDPADKAARERERRITDVERQKTGEQQAAGLTTDLRAVYGLRGMPNIFGTAKRADAPKPIFSGLMK